MPATGHTKRTRSPSGLQINEEPHFQERIWRIERMGWLAMAAILIAAAIGLFGHGMLSRAKVEVTDPAQPAGKMMVEYERFGRAHSESQFVLSGPAATPNKRFSLWLPNDYLQDAELVRITPEPSTQELASNGVRYHFPVQDGPQTVILRFKPERSGRLSGSIRLNDGPPATFDQWIFP
jgi:hypothetical protein